VTDPRVWAPGADRVELVLDERRELLRPDAGGWWSRETGRGSPPLPPGTDYRFALDGGEPLPDPRSPFQPAGVRGPSRTVDHAAFRWTDAGWRPPPLATGVVYELHVGTFTPAGTFDGVIERLDDLEALGVTHVELMPVAEFSGDRGWGYDGVDLYAPHHAYGGPDGLKRLADAAHARGLAVLLDVVYNHLGPEGNVLARYGPYFTQRYRTPWGAAVNFDDRGSPEVRRFVVDNACTWLRDYHLDGLRLDATHAIFDQSAIHILEELRAAVARLERSVGRRLVVIAESDRNDPRLVRAPRRGGYGLDAAWADDVHHALHATLTGERSGYYADYHDPGTLPRVLRTPYLTTGGRSGYRDRLHGRSPGRLPGSRFVAALQNHDQVGNRALGERLAALLPTDRLLVGAALLLAAPYVPLLFAGEEWAASTPFLYFADHADPALGDAVRRGRRAEFAAFGWDPGRIPDPQDERTFAASRLRWEERSVAPHARVLGWYRDVLALRARTPALHDGRRDRVAVTSHREGGLVLRRPPITIAANLGAGGIRLPLSGRLLLASHPSVTLRGNRISLPPNAVAFVEDRG
jgi:maltooligosyltrehalose trehalohydrolase